MANNYSPGQSSGASRFGMLNIVMVGLALLVLYYLYRYLFKQQDASIVTLVPGNASAATTRPIVPDAKVDFPAPFEGGEYSVNTWVYLSSYKAGYGKRKHIFELKGSDTGFSTLVLGLGAFKNNLVVRTHTKDVGTEGFQGSCSSVPKRLEGFVTEGYVDATTSDDLSRANVDTLFGTTAGGTSALDDPVRCDVQDIPLQRWVMVTVVLSGRTTDVYVDGKLARSCVAKSFFKVDPNSVVPVILDRGGFDGYISNLQVAGYALNPEEIYRLYSTGPTGTNLDIISWFLSLFQGAAAK
jgi:hypothetical protein